MSSAVQIVSKGLVKRNDRSAGTSNATKGYISIYIQRHDRTEEFTLYVDQEMDVDVFMTLQVDYDFNSDQTDVVELFL